MFHHRTNRWQSGLTVASILLGMLIVGFSSSSAAPTTATNHSNPQGGATATATFPPGCGYRILILYADAFSDPLTLQADLQAQAGVQTVDRYEVLDQDPTAAQLAGYDLVFVYSYSIFHSPDLLGNLLTGYQYYGGIVVASFGSFYTGGGSGIGGQWRVGGYSPYDYADHSLTDAVTLGVYSPTHPLMQGVSVLTSTRHMDTTLADGATRIAAYSDGSEAVALKPMGSGMAIGLTAYLGDSSIAARGGDYATMIVNAARWLKPNPCRPSPTPTVTPLRPSPTATPTATSTPAIVTASATPTSPIVTDTATPTPPPTITADATATDTPPPPTATVTNVPATATPADPTATSTPLPATATSPPPPSSTPSPTSTPLPSSTPPPSATATAPPLPSNTPTDCADPFTDIGNNVFRAAIHYLYCRGVVNGNGPSSYGPAGISTRAQFAKVVTLGFAIPSYTPATPSFSDVPSSYYAYTYIESGLHAGVLSGFDADTCQQHGVQPPCYLPNLAITRAQLTKLVVNAAGFAPYTPTRPSFSDVPPSNVFYTSIETAHYHAVINGYPDNSFRPNNNIRRDEMAQIVYMAVTAP